MFLRFLSDGGTGLVALGAPVGSRDRGFSLSFSVLVGYGCPKHTMFLYNFNRTLKKHAVVPFKLCFDVAGSFFESVCVLLGPLLGYFGTFLSPLGSPLAPLGTRWVCPLALLGPPWVPWAALGPPTASLEDSLRCL